MTAVRADEPGTIPGRVWEGQHTDLGIDATKPGDTTARLTITADYVNLLGGVVLTAAQLREIAADLLERAEHLDNLAGRNRKTPAWHIREGERELAQAKQHPESSDADVHALIAAAHFQAAQALRSGLNQVVNHHHTSSSGKDTV